MLRWVCPPRPVCWFGVLARSRLRLPGPPRLAARLDLVASWRTPAALVLLPVPRGPVEVVLT